MATFTRGRFCAAVALFFSGTAMAQAPYSWRRLHENGHAFAPPASRDFPSSYAYDYKRGVLVGFGEFVETFGGISRRVLETHERHGDRWIRRSLAVQPKLGAALTYDSAIGSVRAWDGTTLWRWDGSNWIATSSTNTTTTIGSITYDFAHNQLVHVRSDSVATETRVWNGSGWTLADSRSPWASGLVLGSSALGAIVFDAYQSARPRIWDGTQWIVTGTAPQGQVLAIATQSLPVLVTRIGQSSMVQLETFDPFVGLSIPLPGSTIAVDDTYWQNPATASAVFTDRSLILATDRIDEHDGASWKRRFDTRGRIAHDPLRDITVRIGYSAFSFEYTSIFERRSFRDLQIPTPRAQALHWCSAQRGIFAFDTDGAARFDPSGWIKVPSPTKLPTFVRASTYDDSTGTAIFLLDGGETWEWSQAGGYRRIATSIPQGAYSLGYDKDRKVRVLFETTNSSPQVQSIKEWKNGQWTSVATVTGMLFHGILNHVPELGGVAVYGGTARQTPFLTGEIHVWDGTTFRTVSGVQAPDAKDYQSSLQYYDGTRKRYVVLSAHEDYEFGSFAFAPHVAGVQPGGSWQLQHDDATTARLGYVFCFSDRLRPVIPYRVNRYGEPDVLPIGASAVLDTSFALGIVGVLDASGRASLQLPIPAQASLVGLELHGAAVYFGSAGIAGTSAETTLRIVP
ncbi:MAG: hypothetical protein KDC95_10235 [Planctomycetes bacterium]|nr:hypothetical protein [Planctomycetota bacterium]